MASKIQSNKNEFFYSNSINGENESKCMQYELQDSEWNIENQEIINLKRKIEKKGKAIKDWDVKIFYGLKTGYNEAFIIDDMTFRLADHLVTRFAVQPNTDQI